MWIGKRCFDLFFSALGLILLSPIFLIVSVWIKFDSDGPVFFRQERIGKNGVPFYIHKFRTMSTDAERKGLQLTVGQDPRITTSGKLLRRYKIDELPQLIDVLWGDMSLVGPRPEVQRYVSEYPEDVKNIVLSVRPGITDNASIEFKDENDLLANSQDADLEYIRKVLPIKLKYQVDYVKNASFFVDAKIIVRTLKEIFVTR